MKPEISVIRLNQEGYAPGLPVTAAVLSKGLVLLKNTAGEILRTFIPEISGVDPASGDEVALQFVDAFRKNAQRKQGDLVSGRRLRTAVRFPHPLILRTQWCLELRHPRPH